MINWGRRRRKFIFLIILRPKLRFSMFMNFLLLRSGSSGSLRNTFLLAGRRRRGRAALIFKWRSRRFKTLSIILKFDLRIPFIFRPVLF